jgi:hypothetical protein
MRCQTKSYGKYCRNEATHWVWGGIIRKHVTCPGCLLLWEAEGNKAGMEVHSEKIEK